MSRTNIPAGYRFVFGVDPPSGPPNSPPVAVVNAYLSGVKTNAAPTNTPISFSSLGSYDPEGLAVSFSWNFGDGTAISTQANPTHAYSTTNNYNVTLTVSDGVRSVTTNLAMRIFLVGVNLPPSASASATPAGGVAPLTVAFSSAGSSDPEGKPLSYSWTFGDGGSSTAQNPTHIYSNPGVYSARLTVSETTNSASALVTVTVGTGSSGLVASYGFEEGSGTSAADTSGNNNAGTTSGATWAGNGKYGKALTFGAGSVVTVPDSASLDLTTGMTLEAWVYPTSISAAWQNVIFKSQGDPGTSPLCYVMQGSIPSGSVPAVITGVSPSNLAATSPLPVNTWSHLSATYDGSMMRLYVNGVLAGSLAQSGAIAASTQPLSIGGNIYSGQNFVGMIDEVRIYNRALSSSEILTDMNTPIAGGANRPAAPTGLRVVSSQ